MKKSTRLGLMVVMCVLCLNLVCFSSFCLAGGGPVSMLETMKNQVSELRIFLMPVIYNVHEDEIRNLKHGKFPAWDENCIEWYSIPVINREYDSKGIRVPAGSYKIFLTAHGGKEYTPALFYSAQEDVYVIENGVTIHPEIIMLPGGYPIRINIGNGDDLFDSETDGKIQCIVDEDIWIEDVTIGMRYSDEYYGASFFYPYGATDIKLVVNTNDQIFTAPITWEGLIDGEITVNLQPQMTGGIISPDIIWPEDEDPADADMQD